MKPPSLNSYEYHFKNNTRSLDTLISSDPDAFKLKFLREISLPINTEQITLSCKKTNSIFPEWNTVLTESYDIKIKIASSSLFSQPSTHNLENALKNTIKSFVEENKTSSNSNQKKRKRDEQYDREMFIMAIKDSDEATLMKMLKDDLINLPACMEDYYKIDESFSFRSEYCQIAVLLMRTLFENHSEQNERWIEIFEKKPFLKMNGRRYTWMHVLVGENLMNIIRIFPEKNRLFLYANDFEDSPLHFACLKQNYNPRMVDLLLQKGCNVHKTNEVGLTALHLACLENSQEIIPTLLKYGAKLDIENQFGHLNFVDFVIKNQNHDWSCLEKMPPLTHLTHRNKRGQTLFYLALKHNRNDYLHFVQKYFHLQIVEGEFSNEFNQMVLLSHAHTEEQDSEELKKNRNEFFNNFLLNISKVFSTKKEIIKFKSSLLETVLCIQDISMRKILISHYVAEQMKANQPLLTIGIWCKVFPQNPLENETQKKQAKDLLYLFISEMISVENFQTESNNIQKEYIHELFAQFNMQSDVQNQFKRLRPFEQEFPLTCKFMPEFLNSIYHKNHNRFEFILREKFRIIYSSYFMMTIIAALDADNIFALSKLVPMNPEEFNKSEYLQFFLAHFFDTEEHIPVLHSLLTSIWSPIHEQAFAKKYLKKTDDFRMVFKCLMGLKKVDVKKLLIENFFKIIENFENNASIISYLKEHSNLFCEILLDTSHPILQNDSILLFMLKHCIFDEYYIPPGFQFLEYVERLTAMQDKEEVRLILKKILNESLKTSAFDSFDNPIFPRILNCLFHSPFHNLTLEYKTTSQRLNGIFSFFNDSDFRLGSLTSFLRERLSQWMGSNNTLLPALEYSFIQFHAADLLLEKLEQANKNEMLTMVQRHSLFYNHLIFALTENPSLQNQEMREHLCSLIFSTLPSSIKEILTELGYEEEDVYILYPKADECETHNEILVFSPQYFQNNFLEEHPAPTPEMRNNYFRQYIQSSTREFMLSYEKNKDSVLEEVKMYSENHPFPIDQEWGSQLKSQIDLTCLRLQKIKCPTEQNFSISKFLKKQLFEYIGPSLFMKTEKNLMMLINRITSLLTTEISHAHFEDFICKWHKEEDFENAYFFSRDSNSTYEIKRFNSDSAALFPLLKEKIEKKASSLKSFHVIRKMNFEIYESVLLKALKMSYSQEKLTHWTHQQKLAHMVQSHLTFNEAEICEKDRRTSLSLKLEFQDHIFHHFPDNNSLKDKFEILTLFGFLFTRFSSFTFFGEDGASPIPFRDMAVAFFNSAGVVDSSNESLLKQWIKSLIENQCSDFLSENMLPYMKEKTLFTQIVPAAWR